LPPRLARTLLKECRSDVWCVGNKGAEGNRVRGVGRVKDRSRVLSRTVQR
jgi:hypothetical protein